MTRSSASLVGLATRAAATRPGTVALRTAVLTRFALSLRADALRAALEVSRYAAFLVSRHRYSQARDLVRQAARIMGRRPELSVLHLEDCVIDLHCGSGDPRRAALVTQRVLDLADQAWTVEDDTCAVGLLDAVLRLLFHPQRHFGPAGSELARDPEGFLAPLRASRAFREVTRPVAAGAGVSRPGAVGASGRGTRAAPHRVLFVALRNWNFVKDIVADYQADERFEVRTCDLADLPAPPTLRAELARRARLVRGRRHPAGLPARVEADLAWADTIFVEWGSIAAVWASLVAPTAAPRARLLVRIHSYEASTAMPQLVDWSSVSGLVTVSPPIRNLLQASVELPSHLEVSTLPNRALLTRFRLPKEPGAARTIAVVGWAALRKDPAWALDVLDLVRLRDPSWSLLLVGPGFAEDLSGPEARYAEAVSARIEALGDAVRLTGRTQQVPTVLRGAGVILSSSRREGTHEGFIEGVASGALPVVRDWPDVAQWGGPGSLFPRQWVVATPEEAARRILALSHDEVYRSRQAAWMIEHADWGRVRPRYDALLGAPGVGTGTEPQEGQDSEQA